MPLKLDFSANVAAAITTLDDIQRRQVPYATARALTFTARKAQEKVQAIFDGGTFRVRSQSARNRLKKGVRFQPADKRDFPMAASVSDIDYFMELQETGGTKTPEHTQHLAVPRQIRPSPNAPIPRGNRPKDLIGKPKVFKILLGNGQLAIMRRVGQKRYPVQLLYLLREQVHLDPRFQFVKTVKDEALTAWPEEFRNAIHQALSSIDRGK